ncbi:FecR domain-containing protein [bacterium]|nr:FecR domain-containing protein [bacterium]
MLFRRIVLAVILIGVIMTLTAKDKNDKKGIVTFTDGQVKRKTVQAALWSDAPVNTQILSGDKVRTYRQSRAELDLASMDIIRLAPRTIIDIVKLYDETIEKKLQTKIKLEEGELWAQIHEIEMDTEFDISAPIAAAAITGTILSMKVDADSTTQLKVYHGEVHITNAPQNDTLKPKSLKPVQVRGPVQIQGPHEVSVDEWVYIVKSMQQLTLDKNGKVISKGQFSDNDVLEKRDWVKWNKQRDAARTKQLKKHKH